MPQNKIKEKCAWCNKRTLLADGYYCSKCMPKNQIKEKIKKIKGKLYLKNQWWGDVQIELEKMRIGDLLELSCENKKWLVIRRK